MEGLTALGLASNIVQFIDFSSKIIKGAKEIYDSGTGTVPATEGLEDVAKEMQSLSLRLDPPSTGHQNEDERAFRRLAAECRILCTQLLDLIDSVKPSDPKSKRQSIIAAIRGTWSEKERTELERRLDSCRNQLELQLTFLMNSQTKETLTVLAKDIQGGLHLLTELKQHVNQLLEGVKVTSISAEAQVQLRTLLGLSEAACNAHAQSHIRECLAFTDMYSRFDIVDKAHPGSFLWVFDDEMNKACASGGQVVASCNEPNFEEDLETCISSSSERTWDNAEACDSIMWKLDGLSESTLKLDESDHLLSSDSPTSLGPIPEQVDDTISQASSNSSCRQDSADLSSNSTVRETGREFLRWLSSGDGIFHIAGKLGSGKSTLMKFLCEHPCTIWQLQKWAGERQLIFAYYFFWRSGTKLQKSLDGLFRSLVYNILKAYPDLIPTVFPRQWNEVTDPLRLQAPTHLNFRDEEIRTAFEKLVTRQDIHRRHCFCFFIDGLDEYEETRQLDYLAMTKLLQGWTSASGGNVKICVSSREYNVFENAFSIEKRIRLQDLTRTDMERYIEDMLQDMNSQNDRRFLTQRIADRADGIFLWVALVVKSIREVLDESQSLTILEQELEALPGELELLFHHLLCSIRMSARLKGYLLFDMVSFCISYFEEELPLLTCLFLEEYARNPQFAIQSSASFAYSEMDITALQKLATQRLNGYSKGLLEVRGGGKGKYITVTHRSIMEFFQKPSVRAEIGPELGENTAGVAIPQLLLALLRWAEQTPIHDKVMWAFWTCKIMKLQLFKGPNPGKEAYVFLDRLDLELAEKIETSFNDLDLNKTALIRMKSNEPMAIEPIYSSNGNFSVTSTLIIAAALGQFGYVAWRISHPQLLLGKELERWAFLIWALKKGGLFSENDLLDPIEATMREDLRILCWRKLLLFMMQHHSKFIADSRESHVLGNLVELFEVSGVQFSMSFSGTRKMEIANEEDEDEHITTDIHGSGGASSDNPTQGEVFEFCINHAHGGTDKVKVATIVEGSAFCLALQEGRIVTFKEMVEFWDWPNKEKILGRADVEQDFQGGKYDSVYMDELGDLSKEAAMDVSEPKSQSLPIVLQNGQLQSRTQLFTFTRSHIATFLLGGLLSLIISYTLK